MDEKTTARYGSRTRLSGLGSRCLTARPIAQHSTREVCLHLSSPTPAKSNPTLENCFQTTAAAWLDDTHEICGVKGCDNFNAPTTHDFNGRLAESALLSSGPAKALNVMLPDWRASEKSEGRSITKRAVSRGRTGQPSFPLHADFANGFFEMVGLPVEIDGPFEV